MNLLELLSRNWWLIFVRGLCGILFGLVALAWPGVTLLVLVTMYGIYAAMDGGLAIAAAIRGGTIVPRWWLAMIGVISLLAAVVTFTWPNLTILILTTVIGVWGIARGLFEIVGAIQLRKVIVGEWVLILHGLMSIVFGFFLVLRPGEGAIALIWVIALYAITVGLLLVVLSFRLKRLTPTDKPTLDAPPVTSNLS